MITEMTWKFEYHISKQFTVGCHDAKDFLYLVAAGLACKNMFQFQDLAHITHSHEITYMSVERGRTFDQLCGIEAVLTTDTSF